MDRRKTILVDRLLFGTHAFGTRKAMRDGRHNRANPSCPIDARLLSSCRNCLGNKTSRQESEKTVHCHTYSHELSCPFVRSATKIPFCDIGTPFFNSSFQHVGLQIVKFAMDLVQESRSGHTCRRLTSPSAENNQGPVIFNGELFLTHWLRVALRIRREASVDRKNNPALRHIGGLEETPTLLEFPRPRQSRAA